MASGNVKAGRKARHKKLKGSPLLDKRKAPLSFRTHNTGNLNAAFKAARHTPT
jgi:hypothetical protein